ncbi:MAG: hypothetical protein H0W62_11620 [Chitinophagales bacterium]|nr:hypothetical protein [Chitinophagales bacterium]
MDDSRLNQPDPGKQNNRIILLWVLVALLIGINIFMYVKFAKKSTETQQLTEEVNSDSIRIADLDTKYNESLVSIESYRGQNAKLDSMISVKEKQLVSYKANIDQLKRSMRISAADYKKQLDQLQGVQTDLEAQVQQLKDQNQLLITKNDSLGRSLAGQISTNSQLSTTNQALSKKVSIASLLKPTSISAEGIRMKSNGKEDETNNAKKVEKIKVCFSVPESQVADAGQKTFMIRIISPEGVTLAVQSAGSGTFKMADTDEERQYSTSTTMEYDQTAKSNVCTYWQQTTPFAKGSYTAEIYQDGYLVGNTKMQLK